MASQAPLASHLRILKPNLNKPGPNPSVEIPKHGASRPKSFNTAVACDNCRSRKTKCDGQNPCRTCLRDGSQCNFRPQQQRMADIVRELDGCKTTLSYIREALRHDEEIPTRDLRTLAAGSSSVDDMMRRISHAIDPANQPSADLLLPNATSDGSSSSNENGWSHSDVASFLSDSQSIHFTATDDNKFQDGTVNGASKTADGWGGWTGISQSNEYPMQSSTSSDRHNRSSLNDPYGVFPMSADIEANHYPVAIQDHQIACMRLPLHLRQPMHLRADLATTDPTEVFSRLQGEFLDKARGMMLEVNLENIIGPANFDITRLVLTIPTDIVLSHANDLQRWVNIFVSQFRAPFADKVAFACVLMWYMRWLVCPNKDTYRQMPEWLRPTPAAIFIPHLSIYSTSPWAAIRDLLIQSPSDLVLEFADKTSVNWLWNDETVYTMDEKTGKLGISPLFQAHLSDLSNWTLDESILLRHPELSGKAKFRRPVPDLQMMSVSVGA